MHYMFTVAERFKYKSVSSNFLHFKERYFRENGMEWHLETNLCYSFDEREEEMKLWCSVNSG